MEFNADHFDGNPGFQMERKTHENTVKVELGRTQEEIDYDNYKFAVGMKYDLKICPARFRR